MHVEAREGRCFRDFVTRLWLACNIRDPEASVSVFRYPEFFVCPGFFRYPNVCVCVVVVTFLRTLMIVM